MDDETAVSLVAVVGSLRAGSVNRMLFHQAAEWLAPGASLVEATVATLPFYDGDVEAEADPIAVTDLKRAVDESDGLIFFTPEYNRSIPAVTKNALDWLSRPYGDSPIISKPIGIVAATPGGHEVTGVRNHLAASAAGAGGRVFERSLGLGGISETDLEPEAIAALGAWLDGFSEFAMSV